MYQRKDGTWCDTLPRIGKSPKFFYGKTQAEVKKKMREWDERQERGILFREAAELWLKGQESKVREATYYGYQAPYNRLIEKFGDLRVTDITPNMIQNYITQVADMGYSRGRVSIYLVVLNGAFRTAITMEDAVLQFNPCANVKIPSYCKNHIRDLPPKRAVDIIKRNLNEEFGLFPYLLIYSGLRKGEALALTDKDFSKEAISVTKALKYTATGAKIGEPKSDAGVREVVLLKPLAEALPKWKGYLFSLDGGQTPLTNAQFNKLWNNYCMNVGLAHVETVTRHRTRDGKNADWTENRVVRDICCHQLRHEFATICFDAGLDPLDTADMLGHASEEITKQIYTHIKSSRRKKTYSKLQEFVESSY